MVTKCVVPNCGNSCNAKLSVTLFSFPKDSKLVQKWVHATRAQYLKEIKSHHKVCSEHFEKHCILNQFGATRLTPGAIPTIFEWNRLNTGERGAQVQRTTPFLAIRSINNVLSNNRVILPKTTLQRAPVPKVRIPPLVKRIPHPVPKCAAFNMVYSKPLMCDVILPDRRTTLTHQKTNSAILCFEASSSNPVEQNDQDSDDDRGSNGSECVLGDVGNYTLSTKKLKNYKEEAFPDEKDLFIKDGLSDDGSNDPLAVEDYSRESSNAEAASLIEEIVESLQDDTGDHLEDVKDILKSPLGEVIIEECSIIEEEIIPPEKASTPLSLASYLKNEEHRLASKKVKGKGETAQNTKSKLRKLQPRLQKEKARGLQISLASDAASVSSLSSSTTTTITANPVTDISGSQIVKSYLLHQNNPAVLTTPQIKVNQLYPSVNGVVPPMMFQVGNMVLPVTSPVVKTTQLAVQNNAPNSVNRVASHMTYMIPLGGVIPPPLAVKTANFSVTGKLMISGSGQNLLISPETKNKIPTFRKRGQKKKDNAGNEKTVQEASDSTGGTCWSGDSDSMNDGSTLEERLSLELKEIKSALKKKDILVKRLKKDKMNLTLKLKILRRAFLKLRKATVLNLSSSKYLEVG